MTVSLIGALVGLAIGYAAFEAVNMVAKRTEKPETKRVLRIAAMVDVVVFPVVGWFVAPMIFGAA
jgi:F0F1-type ATP synthase membrane subunit c/vacuolar-type H+-ATPase subunit K